MTKLPTFEAFLVLADVFDRSILEVSFEINIVSHHEVLAQEEATANTFLAT